MSLLLALSGCSKADLLNGLVPHDGYKLYSDIAYGQEPRQTLDIYVPERPDPHHTVVVYFHGGSWQFGDKGIYRFLGHSFTSKGYTVAVANYRLYPEVSFPVFIEDSAKAVAWVRANIADYGGDPERIYLVGHSAGAYNAVMLALNKSYLKEAGGGTQWIKGVAGLAGPYDFLPMTDPDIIALFSTARKEADTQPITFARRNAPPVLLLTGDADDEVRPKNTHNLAAKLRKYKSPVEERVYPGVAHIGIVLALADIFNGKAPVLEDIDRFIRKTNGALP